ncbi:iron complex transport system substrate-binding protein [Candidatus Planktophila sulfonica]|uniref:Iron complex transport system substrate-binding protein n=1 Tax=Candidatus Planktophila sulfonica TaxID=1884904 RepID=A0A249KGC0_9ACTN|nr:ABC transporter substrate-binding protein [Candidatus Planktophila sulfonica]ASY15765.1 iron complex transport system substrate-binding protein [Candidatus Planktophila sulfonica]
MRARAKISLISVATITLLLLSGCASQESAVLEISSAKAVNVSTTQAPQVTRVIALANGSAEIIASLGFMSILIGRDIASTDNQLRDIPIVTSGHQVVAEKIIALNPQLVIIDKSTGPASALAALRSAGIAVVQTPEAWTLADIPLKVTRIAQAIGAPQSGEALNRAMARTLEISTQSKVKKRIAFLYLRGGSAIYLIGGKESGADSLIQAIGSIDVGAEKFSNPFTAMTSESILSLNPEIILVMSKGLDSVGGVDGLLALPGIAQTDAGENRRVIAVDDSLLLSFGPRTPNLINRLATAVQKVAP